MREAEQEMNDSCNKPNNVFNVAKFLKKGRTRCKQ